ncbi:hypothetical protein M9Y10_035980 [Tritrichomonas musculus]|uniref:Uncharacterized protein n=1 Tax=Tritrichomonas musculus TaxID=1915356 RepID=A0ABR2GWS5_9EUKA
MSNLENTEISKLVELLNIFEKKHTSLETWLKAVGSNEVMLRYELIDYINEYLSNAKYDGEDNYDNIYWFAKGLSLPPPKPLKRYVDNPEYKENEAISDLFKIQPQPLIKHYVIPHNSKYKQLLNELINNPPLLRPLPPQIMKPLKPYAQKLFEGQNEQYIEFIKQYGHDFKSKDEEYLIVNEPHDREQALRLLQNHRKKYPEETVKVQKTDDPIVVYYLNRISTLEDIFNYLTNTVFKQERKPFKLTFELSGIFELPVNSNNGDVIRYEYDARTINFSNTCRNEYLGNIPIIIQLPQDLERVKLYIESVLHNYNVSESSVKLTIVSSIAFNVSRLVKVTGKIEHLPEEFVKSRLIIADNEDDKLCWYRFLSICLDKTLLKRKLFHRTSKAKMLLCEEHGHPYTTHLTKEAKNIIDNFNGTSVLCQILKLNTFLSLSFLFLRVSLKVCFFL